MTPSMKTIAILGSAYGGARAAHVLAKQVPKGWRIVLVDRNTHANHVYILPRVTVLPGHEHKAFIPYTNAFIMGPHIHPSEPRVDSDPHVLLHACVESISTNSVVLSKGFPEHGVPDDTRTLTFDYMIYALGSHLPAPVNIWGPPSGEPWKEEFSGSKAQSVDWVKRQSKSIENAESVLIVGAGALGIQFASDIASVYPTKTVTLLHSRAQLMAKYDPSVHTQIVDALKELNVEVILGERLDLASTKEDPCKRNVLGQKVVRTEKGREIASDLLLLCTGQLPNTAILKAFDASTLQQDGTAHVLRTLQLSAIPPIEKDADVEAALEAVSLENIDESSTPSPEHKTDPTYPNIFVVGDAADAFGAIKAGHTAYHQGELAAKNIVRLIQRETGETVEGEEELLEYTPGAPAIKVTLGLKKYVYDVAGKVGAGEDGVEDLQASAIWNYFGIKVDDPETDMIH